MTDIAVRAAKTFIQTSFALVTADTFTGLDIATLETAAVAGLAGAISVLMNFILGWANTN